MRETGGELQVTIAQNVGDSWAGIRTDLFDLTGKALWIEHATRPPVMDFVVTYLSFLDSDANRTLEIAHGFDELVINIDNIKVAQWTGPLDEALWWRIREARGTIRFEIGSDGRTWTEVYRMPAGDYVTGDINIGAGTITAIPGGEVARIKGIGVFPPVAAVHRGLRRQLSSPAVTTRAVTAPRLARRFFRPTRGFCVSRGEQRGVRVQPDVDVHALARAMLVSRPMYTLDDHTLTTITGGYARANPDKLDSQLELALTQLKGDIKELAQPPQQSSQLMPLMMMAMMSRR